MEMQHSLCKWNNRRLTGRLNLPKDREIDLSVWGTGNKVILYSTLWQQW